MSRVISFRTDDEVGELLDRMADKSDEDLTRSDVTKRLVEEAAEARLTPLWLRVGLSDRRAAQIEDIRQPGETEEDVARELLADAIDRRDEDVLDMIDATPELRETVEGAREEGESLDDVVARLIRVGANSAAPRTLREEVKSAAMLTFLFAILVGLTDYYGPLPTITVIVFAMIFWLFQPYVEAAVRSRIPQRIT